MTFYWPIFLWSLLLIPALIIFYWWMLQRRKKFAVTYPSLSLVKNVIDTRSHWRRHIPPFLLLLAVTLMLLALARPAAVITLSSKYATVILAIDVSASMRAKDIMPSRIETAQSAAKSYVNDQPKSTRIGLVSFAGTAALIQTPTLLKEDVLTAIDRLQLQRGTAIGSGLLVSLQTIFPDIKLDLRFKDPRPSSLSATETDYIQSAAQPHTPINPGSYQSAVIILLTDGASTTGPDPIISARMVAEHGVPVFTVGLGTPAGEIVGADGLSMRVRLDEAVLREIASITGGEYFQASNATDLQKVYQSMASRTVLEKKETELSALFAGIAALITITAAMLSMWWFNRIF